MSTQFVSPVVREILHNAAGADADGASLVVQRAEGSYALGAFQLSGTLTSVIVYFECTVDGDNWVAMECQSVADSTVFATSATAAGVWVFRAFGLYKVRARLDWTTGSVTVWGSLVA